MLTSNGNPTPNAAGLTWQNQGTVNASNSTVNLQGTFTVAALGTFNRTGGTVNLQGTLNNPGTLLLNSTTGSWNLNGGTVSGGSLAAAAGLRWW